MEPRIRKFPPRELELITIAESNPSDKEAEAAMAILREEFDPTYHWCWECDGLVTTTKDCCLTNLTKEGIEENPEDSSTLPF